MGLESVHGERIRTVGTFMHDLLSSPQFHHLNVLESSTQFLRLQEHLRPNSPRQNDAQKPRLLAACNQLDGVHSCPALNQERSTENINRFTKKIAKNEGKSLKFIMFVILFNH